AMLGPRSSRASPRGAPGLWPVGPASGVRSRSRQPLLAVLQGADRIDWGHAAVDGPHACALGGGEATCPSPVERGTVGSEHHVVVDRGGPRLAAPTTTGYVPDVHELGAVVDAIPPERGRRGRRREMFGGRGHDTGPRRCRVRRRGIRPPFARRND